MNEKLDVIETCTCSRCGGTGKHSYCQQWGDTCFKCGGAGKVFTKRGAAARNFLTALRSLPFADLRPGMQIQFCGMSGWQTVLALSVEFGTSPREVVETDKCVMAGLPGATYRVRQTAGSIASTLAEALAFQSTLTKQGMPRKD